MIIPDEKNPVNFYLSSASTNAMNPRASVAAPQIVNTHVRISIDMASSFV